MNAQHNEWKRTVDELWSAHALDHAKAARIVAEIARQEEKGFLQQAAAQALPSMRRAAQKGTDRMSRTMARRRFSAVRDALHAVTAPRFGRRRGTDDPADPEEEHRRMLGLPLGRRLFGPEIKDAYKRAAKRMHPDTGGSARAFLALSAARDALMKGR